ncbi:MAG: hypothetical protein ABIL58_02060 [Pseudomonadota bacterium]
MTVSVCFLQKKEGGVVTPLHITGRYENGGLLMEVMINGQRVGAVTIQA